jgi:hypothetical protein
LHRKVRQSRAGVGEGKIDRVSSGSATTPVSSALATDNAGADQGCGRREQFSARKTVRPATPGTRTNADPRNLLRPVQKQNCLRSVQLMISF